MYYYTIFDGDLPLLRQVGLTERSKGFSFGSSESYKELMDWELNVRFSR